MNGGLARCGDCRADARTCDRVRRPDGSLAHPSQTCQRRPMRTAVSVATTDTRRPSSRMAMRLARPRCERPRWRGRVASCTDVAPDAVAAPGWAGRTRRHGSHRGAIDADGDAGLDGAALEPAAGARPASATSGCRVDSVGSPACRHHGDGSRRHRGRGSRRHRAPPLLRPCLGGDDDVGRGSGGLAPWRACQWRQARGRQARVGPRTETRWRRPDDRPAVAPERAREARSPAGRSPVRALGAPSFPPVTPTSGGVRCGEGTTSSVDPQGAAFDERRVDQASGRTAKSSNHCVKLAKSGLRWSLLGRKVRMR